MRRPRARRDGAPGVARLSGRSGVGAVLVLIFGLAAAYRALLEPVIREADGPAFRLVDGSGAVRTPSSFGGRYTLVFFGYASCRDICPVALGRIAGVLRDVDPDTRRIQPVFITIDPAHDTQAAMRSFVDQFSSGFVTLTGSTEALAAVRRRFGVVVEAQDVGTHRDFDHTANLFVLDPAGRLVEKLDPDAPLAELETSLRHLQA